MQSLALDAKTVLITGASSGIGKGIALACAQAGARCILLARNRERLTETLSECAGSGHETVVADLSSDADLQSLLLALPQLDGVVHCAGRGDNNTPLKFLTPDFVDEILAVNLRAPILLLAFLAKKRKLNKGASVVMISSIAGFHATVAHSLYGATKGGLTSFVKGAAMDLAGSRVRVNSIAPGMVNTPLIDFSRLTEDQKLANVARYPLKRYGEPSDIAGAALYLLSDASSWVTGQQFVVDGGFTIGG